MLVFLQTNLSAEGSSTQTFVLNLIELWFICVASIILDSTFYPFSIPWKLRLCQSTQ